VKEKEYEITAELPGMDESNIDVKFADGVLTIKGEKKEEKERRKRITISPSAALAPSSAASRFRKA
jgi:HSP20 family molecular chaperone IbpA